MSKPLIQANNLTKYFQVKKGTLHAVDGISFSIDRGRTLGVVGESGCGKTTLGRAAIQLVKPTSGEVLFKGRDIVHCTGEERKNLHREVSIVFQDPYSSLNSRMSVFELIADPMMVNRTCPDKTQMDKRVRALMDTVGLARRVENCYPHELDGGRRQRIGIARALALDPEFIVCDEPVSALDVSIQAQILNLLMDLQQNLGLTYLFITHDLLVVRHLSHEIMVMYLGRCVERASCEALFRNPVHPYTKALLSAVPIPDLSRRGKRPELLTGEVSSPINPKPGCRFAPRCPCASGLCRTEMPPESEVEPGHTVCCHFAGRPG